MHKLGFHEEGAESDEVPRGEVIERRGGPNHVDPPPTVSLTGVVRDFRERTVAGGHPDFERRPAEGFGQYCKNVEEELGANGKPEYNSCGFKLTQQWKNSAGKNICWLLYDDDLGDAARARAQASARAQERQRPGRAQRHDRQPTCARVRARLEPTSAPHGSRRAARSLCVESITVILKSLYSCNET